MSVMARQVAGAIPVGDHLINPPLFISGNEVVLCPPLDVPSYMEYAREHREDYRRFFDLGE